MKTLDITCSVGRVWEASATRDAIWAARPLNEYCAEAIEITQRESVEVVFPFNSSKVHVKKNSNVADLVLTYLAEEAVRIEKWCKSPGGRKVQVEDVVNCVVEEGEFTGLKQAPESVRAAFMKAIPVVNVRHITFTAEEIDEACELILDRQSEMVLREVVAA